MSVTPPEPAPLPELPRPEALPQPPALPEPPRPEALAGPPALPEPPRPEAAAQPPAVCVLTIHHEVANLMLHYSAHPVLPKPSVQVCWACTRCPSLARPEAAAEPPAVYFPPIQL